MRYNWQQDNWGKFTFDLSAVESHLLLYTEKTAHLTGMLRALPEHLRSEAVVNLMTAEALKTSEIEGEFIQREDVMSSIRNNLGLNPVPEIVHDLRAIGLGQMMTEVRKTFAEPLNHNDLFLWHRLLLSYRPSANGANTPSPCRLSPAPWEGNGFTSKPHPHRLCPE